MFYLVVLRRIMFALALLGIVVGPVSASTSASAMAAASSDMQTAAMPDMDMASADEMPCCPDEQPAPQKKACGPTCPLALLCSTTILAQKDNSVGWRVDLTLLALSHDLLQEGHLPSAIVEPPARPPKA
ncbi:hypothetical protein [Rhizobium sp. GN54]|uniref:hypothetical protein n=1 Tax=Rhizobium sp. GN54 TaxID=2898150 RepID=UPI001E36236C|nr:hypothetical protein [Rhizobium sp. GN54]MCD2185463.1 hypothetical protein [Rhizobium sp. GN54]